MLDAKTTTFLIAHLCVVRSASSVISTSFTCQWTANILPVTVLPSSMIEQSIFKDVPCSVPGRAARMSALSVRPVLRSIAHLYFQLRRLTRRLVSKSHQLQSTFESTKVSVPAEVVDAKTSAEGSPVEFLFMLFGTSTVLLISHARAHCRLPHGPTCGDMDGMPGWICHCNATATHIAPVRTQHATFTCTSTYAQKSKGGHPWCDLAPLTTSFGTGSVGAPAPGNGCYDKP